MYDSTTTETQLLAQLKQHKHYKGEIARQFKHVEKGSHAHKLLLEQMKSISALINQTEAAIKSKHLEAISRRIKPSEIKQAFDYLEPDAIWSDEIITCLANEQQIHQWYSYLHHELHSPYHTKEWLELIERTFGHQSIILIASDSHGKILGGMPLTFFSSKLFGQFAVSIPFINYGGPISRYKNVNTKLIEYATSLLSQYQLSHIEIRCLQSGHHSLYTQRKASMILELPASDELLEKALGAKLRSQYKKAEDHHPVLFTGKLELLDDFYNVFARNMRDLGTPVYPKEFFAAILKETKIESRIMIVKLEKKAVSAAFLIGNNNVLEIPWASTVSAANKKNMNMWMYRKILSFAIEQRYDFFDFGRSTIDAGTYKFKKQWGAQPRQHYWYYLLPEGQQLPEISPNNPKYKLFILLWKLMPVWLSRLIGPLLIKHIP